MDKTVWINRMEPLGRAFLDSSLPNKRPNKRLQAIFGCSINKTYIGRVAFQNIYDLVSSWPCWNPLIQSRDWDVKLQFEVPSSQVIPTNQNSGVTAGRLPGKSGYFIETDEQCVDVKCYSISQDPPENVDMNIKWSKDKKEIGSVTAQHLIVDTQLFKLAPHASFCSVTVLKRKRFEFTTHFHWTYEFTLSWSVPFVDEKEEMYIFKQDPKCEVKVICDHLPSSETYTLEYLAESFLYKIHECIPSIYRSPDGTSVSFVP